MAAHNSSSKGSNTLTQVHVQERKMEISTGMTRRRNKKLWIPSRGPRIQSTQHTEDTNFSKTLPRDFIKNIKAMECILERWIKTGKEGQKKGLVRILVSFKAQKCYGNMFLLYPRVLYSKGLCKCSCSDRRVSWNLEGSPGTTQLWGEEDSH